MFPYHLLEDPTLKKNIRAIAAKEYLFEQGEKGNTMFIIVEGTVALYQATLTKTRLVDLATKGEMLGEKAVVFNEPYKRTLSAQAVTDVILLELDRSNLKLLSAKVPQFMNSVLRYVIRRLDKANDLIGTLQLRDDTERTLQYILYWARHNGRKSLQGVEINLSADDISATINVPKEMVDEVFHVLTQKKLILRKNDLVLIPDETAILAFLPTLRDRIAA